MPCCPETIKPFFNETVTTINYGPSLQSAYGAAPKVTVLYWDGSQYVAAGIFTSVSFNTYPVGIITVDHGSDSATGLIKLS